MKTAGLVGNKIWAGLGESSIIETNSQTTEPELEFFTKIENNSTDLYRYPIVFHESDKDENSFLIESVDFQYIALLQHVQSIISVIHWFISKLKTGNKEILSN